MPSKAWIQDFSSLLHRMSIHLHRLIGNPFLTLQNNFNNDFSTICTGLWCFDPDTTIASCKLVVPFDYTTCGTGKVRIGCWSSREFFTHMERSSNADVTLHALLSNEGSFACNKFCYTGNLFHSCLRGLLLQPRSYLCRGRNGTPNPLRACYLSSQRSGDERIQIIHLHVYMYIYKIFFFLN